MKEMMTTANAANAREQSSTPQRPMSCCGSTPSTGSEGSSSPVVSGVRRFLGGRRGLILLAIAVLGVGAFLNWGWLVAAGIAPLLLAFAPCAAMCALGLCMNKMGGKSCSTKSNASDQNAEATPSTPNAEANPSPTIASAKAGETVSALTR